jgi:hypothetical protein
LSIYPDAYILAQPIDSLLRAAREEHSVNDSSQNLHSRFTRNLDRLRRNPVQMVAEVDDRQSRLSAGRFLPGAAATAQHLWAEARRHGGENGWDPIATFDVKTTGLTSCVNARGWELLHRPGNESISIKLFTTSNAAYSHAASTRTLSLSGDNVLINESLKEMTDAIQVRKALDNLRTAAQLVRPWDFSIRALQVSFQNFFS